MAYIIFVLRTMTCFLFWTLLLSFLSSFIRSLVDRPFNIHSFYINFIHFQIKQPIRSSKYSRLVPMPTNAHATIRDPTQPSVFLWIRSIAFSSIIFLCFLWIVLLSAVLFAQWDTMNRTERSLIFIMLVIDSITVIMLPLLLLQSFRLWLDAARFFLLIILHTGIAGLFTYKTSGFQCSSAQSVDQRAVCSLIVLFVIISSWLVAACIIGYACGLAILFVRLSRVSPVPLVDPESLKKTKTNHAT